MKISKPSKQGVIRETKDYLMIALGMILYGIGWTLFLLPNDITTGGVPGIASIVYFATGFPVQYTYFAINAVLLMVSLKVLGFRFSLKTIFGVFTLTFFLSVIQKLTANVTLLHDQPFMACVLGASFCGSGIGIAFSANGSTEITGEAGEDALTIWTSTKAAGRAGAAWQASLSTWERTRM